MSAPVQKWKPVYTRILEMHIKGMTSVLIASKVGINKCHIASIMASEEFQRRKRQMEKKVTDRVYEEFEDFAIKAVKKIKAIARCGKPDQRVQLDAAIQVLHQLGCKPREVVETVSRTYTIEEVNSARDTFSEVERMMERLSVKKSNFVVPKSEESSKTQGENVGTIPSGEVGQETVSTEPVLPV